MRIKWYSLHRGFTLLELLVVMTLATLVLAVVPASFSSMVPHVEQQSQIRDLVFALRSARGQAIRASQNATFTLNLATRQYSLNGTGVTRKLPEDFHVTFIPPFQQIVDSQQIEIHFFADGSSSGGLIRMASKDMQYDISIDWLSGRIAYHEKDSYGS